jgi:hypothetical protein
MLVMLASSRFWRVRIMARFAFIMYRIFRRFACRANRLSHAYRHGLRQLPAFMASRTIETTATGKMTIMTYVYPLRGKAALIDLIRTRCSGRVVGRPSSVFHGYRRQCLLGTSQKRG